MIPKTIHQIIGPNPSPLIKKCMESWLQTNNYGYEMRKWTDSDLLKFISSKYPFALEPFINARNYAEASDIARYLLIFHYGGYYLDWDIQMISLPRFLEFTKTYPNGFVLQDPVNQSLASEAFSACAGDPFLFKIVDNIQTIYSNGFRNSLNTPQYSGPYRMREVYYFLKGNVNPVPVEIKNFFLYDYWEINNPPSREINVPAIHYWNHGWMKKK